MSDPRVWDWTPVIEVRCPRCGCPFRTREPAPRCPRCRLVDSDLD